MDGWLITRKLPHSFIRALNSHVRPVNQNKNNSFRDLWIKKRIRIILEDKEVLGDFQWLWIQVSKMKIKKFIGWSHLIFFFFLLIFEALLNAEISTTDYMNGYLTKSTQKLGGIEAERYLLGVENWENIIKMWISHN